MGYKRRESQEKQCQHCGKPFASSHKSRIYCSSSCNTLAWMKRRHVNVDSSAQGGGQQKATLDFNAPNVATLAAGSLAADGVKKFGKALFGYKSDEEKKIDLLIEEVRQLRAERTGQTSPHPVNRPNLVPDERNQEWQDTGKRMYLDVFFYGDTEFIGVSDGKTLYYINRPLQLIAIENGKGNFEAIPRQVWLDQMARMKKGQKRLRPRQPGASD